MNWYFSISKKVRSPSHQPSSMTRVQGTMILGEFVLSSTSDLHHRHSRTVYPVGHATAYLSDSGSSPSPHTECFILGTLILLGFVNRFESFAPRAKGQHFSQANRYFFKYIFSLFG